MYYILYVIFNLYQLFIYYTNFKTRPSLFPALTHQYLYSVSPRSGPHHPLECSTELPSTILELGLSIHLLAILHSCNTGSTLQSGTVLWRLPSWPSLCTAIPWNYVCDGWFTSNFERCVLCCWHQSRGSTSSCATWSPRLQLGLDCPVFPLSLYCWFHSFGRIGYGGAPGSLSCHPHWLSDSLPLSSSATPVGPCRSYLVVPVGTVLRAKASSGEAGEGAYRAAVIVFTGT